jgi:hypothetical protein
MAQRILAVMAAALLVGSVALATIGPPEMPLGQALFMIDHNILNVLQTDVDSYLAHWVWTYVLVPFLLRPAWLLPAVLAVICAGLSMTLASRQEAHNQRRRS